MRGAYGSEWERGDVGWLTATRREMEGTVESRNPTLDEGDYRPAATQPRQRGSSACQATATRCRGRGPTVAATRHVMEGTLDSRNLTPPMELSVHEG